MPNTQKLPPQNIEAEQSLLGALLIDKDAIVKIAEILTPTHFYKSTQHGKIYEAILELYEKREPIDLVTVTEKLKQNEALDLVGGSAYLTTLVNAVPTSAHIEHYCRIIKEHAVRRLLITQATKLVETAYDEATPIEDLLDGAEQGIFSISQDSVRRDFMAIKDLLTASFDRLDELQKNSGKLRGVPSGFRDLDNKLAGFQESNLIIFAARPGQGKCLAFDTKIVNPETGELFTIADYYYQKIVPIFSLGPKLKIEQKYISQFVDDGLKEVFRVRTALGKEIEVTASHPFLTIDGWKQLESIKVGEKIAIPRKLTVSGKLNLEDFKVKALAYFLSDGGLTNSCPRFTNTNPIIVSDFIESVLQFGRVKVQKYDSGGKRAPSYEIVKADIPNRSSLLMDFSQRLKSHLKAQDITQIGLGKILNVSPATVSLWVNGFTLPKDQTLSILGDHFYPFSGVIGKNSVSLWLQQLSLVGKNALQKEIPNIVFRLTNKKLSLFLNRLFACDGSVYVSNRGPVISYASSSKQLIYSVQHLLLRFGIISKIRSKKIKYKQSLRDSFELEIRDSQDIINFYQEIGILGKSDKLFQVFELAQKRQQQNNFSRDTIPQEIWKQILLAKGNMSWRQIYQRIGLPLSHNFHIGKRNPKRATILKIAKALNLPHLINLAESDIFWDRIISIEYIGRKQVFDLTIPDTHNFVANDFFVHNTSFVLNVAQHVAVKEELPVGIFSLEMSQEELVDRLLVGQADIDAWKLKTGKMDDKDFERLSHAMGQLAEAPLFIDDTPGLSMAEIRTKARRLQLEHGLKLLVVDYLQLITGRNLENRVQEVSEISRSLKNLARELKIPIIAISQLSRAVENRGTRKPQLADLRESGAIEQDADVVMFIYREDAENIKDVTLDIQKHRNGPTGEIKLMFIPERVRFYGMERTRVKAAPKSEPESSHTAAR